MDATAFEFVYLSFVNSMFLSTFALLCPLVWLPVYLFVFGLRSSIPFLNPIAIPIPIPVPVPIAAPILRLWLVNIPLPIEFVSIYLLHGQNGANFVCAMRPITT